MLCCSWRHATYQIWVVPYDLDIESSKMNNLPLSELSAISSNQACVTVRSIPTACGPIIGSYGTPSWILDGVGVGWMRWRFEMWGLGEGLNGCFGFAADESRTFCVVGLDGLDWTRLDVRVPYVLVLHVVFAAFKGHC